MNETVQAFILSINKRKHVLTLIEDAALTIEFRMKDETFYLFLKNGEVFPADGPCDPFSIFRISGDKERIKDLISGREKLRTSLMRGDLQCSAPFRTILRLESFFYLGKTEQIMAKIS
jgi:hypothetical protein